MITVNTNTTATLASQNLGRSNFMLQKSLTRLSSGKRIVSPFDDAGGLAVSNKLTATINRTDAVGRNVSNGVSFLQTQDGALKTVSAIVDRMSELRTMADDVTKNTSDIANYDTEFTQLKLQMSNLASEQFNGISLFASSGAAGTKTVYTSEKGAGASSVSVALSQASLGANLITTGGIDLANGTSVSGLMVASVADLTTIIERVATMRATNGAQASRLMFAQQQLEANKGNLEAANSRIMDTDVASESTAFAKYNILVQSGASMLAQANSLSNVALSLLG
tara:strand:- start:71 stop:913 length:843 start_codon:yes stop_codon:yes gene_type:complete